MNCVKLIEAAKKSRHHSKWVKDEIKKYEKIEDKTNEERWKLCNLYTVLTQVPFTHNEIYDLCEGCEFEDLYTRCHGVDTSKI